MRTLLYLLGVCCLLQSVYSQVDPIDLQTNALASIVADDVAQTVTEGDSVDVCITVDFRSSNIATATVMYTVLLNTATSNDYTTSPSGPFVFNPTEQVDQCVTIQAVEDGVMEGPEQLTLFIFSGPNDNLVEDPFQAVITIVDPEVADPCSPSPCDANAACTTVNNAAVCTCNAGFVGNGFVCTVADPCSPSPCDANAACTTVNNAAVCTCNAGFVGNGFVCSLIDPCSPSPCDANAACTTVNNAAVCTCNAGFVGNGFVCMAMSGGADPHFSIILPSGELLCFTVQGERDFAFNLVSTNRVHINALFSPDSVREEVTWMGALGVIVHGENYLESNKTSLRFNAEDMTVSVGEKAKLKVRDVKSLKFANGKLVVTPMEAGDEEEKHPSVCVNLEDVGLHFHVTYYGEHLDIFWNSVSIDNEGNKHIHGLIGQFFRDGVTIDTVRKLLLLPKMEPVPISRKPVWSFMEHDMDLDQMCWAAMNPGYQGEGLIQGSYMDYLVNDVLDDKYKYKN